MEKVIKSIKILQIILSVVSIIGLISLLIIGILTNRLGTNAALIGNLSTIFLLMLFILSLISLLIGVVSYFMAKHKNKKKNVSESFTNVLIKLGIIGMVASFVLFFY